MSVYLDANVIVPRFLIEASTPRVKTFLRVINEPVIASDLAAAEFAATLSRQVRTKHLDEVRARQALDLFDDWRRNYTVGASLEGADVTSADALVRRFELKLMTPDAIHIMLARRLGATLVTLDVRMADAAEALGLPVDRLSA